jgi:hypothetical protein
MSLVVFSVDSGSGLHLFFWSDQYPHCLHLVVEGVGFIDLPANRNEWHFDTNAEPHVLARSKRSPLKFKAFRSELDVHSGWEIVDGVAEVWSTWDAFCRTPR